MSDGFVAFGDEKGGNEEDNEQLRVFTDEFGETLQSLESEIIELETDPNSKDRVNSIFRLFHNLKGSSAMMSFMIIKDITHYCEYVLDLVRTGKSALTAEHVDLFLEATTALKEIYTNLREKKSEGEKRFFLLMHRLESLYLESEGLVVGEEEKKKEEEGKAESGKSEEGKESEQIKVSRQVINQMMLLVGEFMLLKNKIQWLRNRYGKDREFLDNCEELDQFSAKLQRVEAYPVF